MASYILLTPLRVRDPETGARRDIPEGETVELDDIEAADLAAAGAIDAPNLLAPAKAARAGKAKAAS